MTTQEKIDSIDWWAFARQYNLSPEEFFQAAVSNALASGVTLIEMKGVNITELKFETPIGTLTIDTKAKVFNDI